MASVDQPPNAAATDLFDEDLDDEDDEDDDSATSAVDRPPPPPGFPAQPMNMILPDPHPHPLLRLPPIPPENTIAKRLPIPDESRKLFQRLWTDEDEIELLQGFLDYTTQRCGPNGSSQHHHDTTAFYDQIKSKFQLDFNKNQLVEKLRRLKKKYRNVVTKSGNNAKDYSFKSPHEQATFEISSKIWGTSASAAAGGGAARAAPPAPIDEEDDDVNLNFVDYQSPNLNGIGIDMNSKTPPRSRKRNRIGSVKLEEKQQPPANINLNYTQPSVTPTPTPIVPPPATGLSNLIEETLKSCLSPIFKELLSNSMSSNSNQNGFGLGRGPIPFGLGTGDKVSSPIPFCFGAGIGGGDKASSERWRKQHIMELEVFSKRLELVQDEIREQLHDLRSMGN